MTAKVALVTGGARGIGREIAVELAEAGCDVAVGYRVNATAASEAVEMIRSKGRRAVAIGLDISATGTGRQLIRNVVIELGRVDVVVANAGRLETSPFLSTTPQQYDLQADTNARGAFFVVQAAAEQMIAQGTPGRIIVITSDAAVRSYAGLSAYAMSKAAQRMLVHSAARELAQYGITANAVAPGTIETDMNREALADPETRPMLLGSILLGRPGSPRDVAHAVRFLASDESAFVTGATIAVDGGAAIH